MGGYILHKTLGENTKLSQLLWSIQKPYMNHLLPYIWHHTLLIHTSLQRKPNLSQGKTEIKLLEVALRKFDLEGLINKTSDPQMALQRTWLSRVNQSWEGSYETTPYISLNDWSHSINRVPFSEATRLSLRRKQEEIKAIHLICQQEV